jgi:hypothetical protein
VRGLKMDSSGSGLEKVVGFCEYSIELSDSIKFREFLD